MDVFGSRQREPCQIPGAANILASDSSAPGLPTVGEKNTQGQRKWAWASQYFGSKPSSSRRTRACNFFLVRLALAQNQTHLISQYLGEKFCVGERIILYAVEALLIHELARPVEEKLKVGRMWDGSRRGSDGCKSCI